MKIGIFDSGLGGLIIAKAIHKAMPEYDYVYLGDTKRVPYGNRSHETVYQFTKEAMEYLFKKENCALVVLACNTASARALRRIQADYKNTDKKVLGVLIPTAEECVDLKKVGILATRGTVSSETFVKEIKKVNKNCVVYQNPAPMLVPFAEEGEHGLSIPFILKYLKPLMEKNVEAIILGCTHYPIFKKEFKKILPKNIKLISQDEIIPKKLKDYLKRHQEVEKKLSHKKTIKILVTDKTQNVEKLTKEWFGENTKPKSIDL
jgi:glutamate racemase